MEIEEEDIPTDTIERTRGKKRIGRDHLIILKELATEMKSIDSDGIQRNFSSSNSLKVRKSEDRNEKPLLRPSNTSPVRLRTVVRRIGSPRPKETVQNRLRNDESRVWTLTRSTQKEEKVKEKEKLKKRKLGTEFYPITRSKRRDQDPDKDGNGLGSSIASAIVLGLFDKVGKENL
jgi:hypothetical protein